MTEHPSMIMYMYSIKNISQSRACSVCPPIQSFAKLSCIAIDNVLTNQLPAGLIDFFHLLHVSDVTTVNKLLECSPRSNIGYSVANFWSHKSFWKIFTRQLLNVRQSTANPYSKRRHSKNWFSGLLTLHNQSRRSVYAFNFCFVFQIQKCDFYVFLSIFPICFWISLIHQNW